MSAALTTPGARNLRPVAALGAVFVTAMVLGGLIGYVGSQMAPIQRAEPRPAVVPGTIGATDQLGVPYVGTGPAADIIRGDATVGSLSVGHSAATVQVGIPYVGTGPTADKIRAASAVTMQACPAK